MHGGVAGDGDDHADRVRRRLRVAQLTEADDVAGRLLDPVAPGDADVEQALGDVGRDLLRAQDAHLGHPRVVDRRPVLDRRRAHDGEVGGLEELERRPLQRSLGQHDAQHGAGRYRPGGRRRSAVPAATAVAQCSVGASCSRRRAWGSTSRIAPSCSTQPFGEPGVLQTIACPRIAGDAPRQPAERADQAHRLGQPGRLALDDLPGALRRLVPRGEPGAARRDDQAGEAVGQLGEGRGDRRRRRPR